jgi:cytochrome c-type biogenesis protein CcmF
VLPLRGRNLRRLPLATWGMVIAHLGIAVALLGMASESAFSEEKLAAVRAGESATVGPWSVRLASVDPVAGPNWTALEGVMQASYAGGSPIELHPQARSFWSPPQETTESALVTRWNGQLYAVLGKAADGERWQVRLWWKPFVTLIWYGGLMIALGGVLALIGRVSDDLRRRFVQRKASARRKELAA